MMKNLKIIVGIYWAVLLMAYCLLPFAVPSLAPKYSGWVCVTLILSLPFVLIICIKMQNWLEK